MATKRSTVSSTSSSDSSSVDLSGIEERLQALESQAHTPCGGSDSDRIAALEARIDDLVAKLSKKISF